MFMVASQAREGVAAERTLSLRDYPEVRALLSETGAHAM